MGRLEIGDSADDTIKAGRFLLVGAIDVLVCVDLLVRILRKGARRTKEAAANPDGNLPVRRDIKGVAVETNRTLVT